MTVNYLMVEEEYQASVWCRQLLRGLQEELRRRREAFETGSALPALSSEDTVFIVGADPGWLAAAIAGCNRAGKVPVVLCNSSRRIQVGRYHCVCSDIAGSMAQLLLSLRQSRGEQIALYGVNPHSVGDQSRREAFLQACPREDAVFENRTGLADCFESFLPEAGRYRTVVCANGFAAISLYKGLRDRAPELLKSLTVISCAQTLLSRYYQNRIHSVDLNLPAFGKTALGILDLCRKQPFIQNITAAITWSMPGMTLTRDVAPPPPSPEPGTFYRDRELQQLLLLENLLNTGDEIDLTLLQCILSGMNYSRMAQRCYLSEGAVKYRIRKMCALCQVPNRKALQALLRENIELP